MIDQTSFFFDYGTETVAFEAEFASTPLESMNKYRYKWNRWSSGKTVFCIQ